MDQLVAQTARLGWTVGVTSDNLVGAQCRAVVGLGNAKDPAWKSGQHMVGVWFEDQPGAQAHQAAMHCVEDGSMKRWHSAFEFRPARSAGHRSCFMPHPAR